MLDSAHTMQYLCIYFFRFAVPKTIKFSTYHAAALSQNYAQLVLESLQNKAPKAYLEGDNYFRLGNLLLGTGTCQITVHASNYTFEYSKTIGPSITATAGPTTSYSKI